MAYVPTNWTDGSGEPISAENLNHIETGISDAHTQLDDMSSDISDLKTSNAGKLNTSAFISMFSVSEETRNPYSIPHTSDGKTYNYATGSSTISKTGYHPLAIIGWSLSGDNCSFIYPYRLELDNRKYENGKGSATLNYGLRTTNSSYKWSGNLVLDILWIKR